MVRLLATDVIVPPALLLLLPLGQAEVRVVCDVEELRPKLQIDTLRQTAILAHAEIEIL
jgi:hypothetical protein